MLIKVQTLVSAKQSLVKSLLCIQPTHGIRAVYNTRATF